MNWPKPAYALLLAVTLSCYAHAQDPAFPPPNSLNGFTSLNGISDKALDALNARYTMLNKIVQRHAEKMLRRMEKKELALQGKLNDKDSIRGVILFAETRSKYRQLLTQVQTSGNNLSANPLKQYLPGVDSIQTALRFLNQPGVAGLPAQQLQKVRTVSLQLQQLQGSLQNANDVQSYLHTRELQLKDQLSQYGLGKQLAGINSEVYYYQTQLTQYKNTLNDPDKRQQAILSAVRQLPAFQHFFQNNSYWSKLFPLQENVGTPQAIAGLQTRDQINQELKQKFGVLPLSVGAGGGGGGSGASYLQNKMQTARTQLEAIKNQLTRSGATSSGMTMPDFQPNSQHIKPFLKRLEYSFTIQNTASTSLLPAISSLGLNIGYKISDKATAGIGGTYLLGLGTGLDHIRLSNQGIGLRTYTDIRAKGSIWITGSLEYTYMQQFAYLQDIRNIDIWQKSALIGLTKKYNIGKRSGNLQLLYDLLANTELPKGQPLVFRMGWGF